MSACGSSLFLSLPEDLLAIISMWLSPLDIFNISMSCHVLSHLASSEMLWLTQCDMLGFIPRQEMVRWRQGISSYRALCRFLLRVRSVVGIWVHQNPELGNVVYVIPGFMSVVGCRIIPQELAPLGIEQTNLLWCPVFEIIGRDDGSTMFFLHGRVSEEDYVYPGSLADVDSTCNILLLEVHPTANHNNTQPTFPFGKLAFGDRRKMLDTVSGHVRLKLPPAYANSPLFPRSTQDEGDFYLLSQRRSFLLGTVSDIDMRPSWSEMWQFPRKKTFGGCLHNGIKRMLGKSDTGSGQKGTSIRHARLRQFLDCGDSVRLTLRASTTNISSYRAWPNMHDNRFALYKLPMRLPEMGVELAGLWGGAFGSPCWNSTPGDIRGKALFLVALSYEESQGQRLLIATKILEGTHYVLHPNGSAMFVANVDEPARDISFPLDLDVVSFGEFDVKKVFSGEGIANGYGFRYPGSKPGLLYVIGDKFLAFMWKETSALLTLQRINLSDLLRRGERVPSLPPIPNFSYLTKSYSNVFSCSGCSSSPRADGGIVEP